MSSGKRARWLLRRGLSWSRSSARLFVIVLNICAAPFVHAGNVFDENWTPPKPAKPVAPDAPANTPPTTTIASPARRSIPAPGDQAKSRKMFKEIFATELADQTPAACRALAVKLIEQAAGIADAPTDHFVLLVGAIEAGKEASDLGLCIQAADAMAAAFDVDGLQIKSDAAWRMALRADSPAITTQNCRLGLALVDQLVAADDYATAGRLLPALQAAAPDAALSSQIQDRAKETDALRTAAERVAPDRQKLKTDPDDTAANLAVGRYLCLTKGDWKQGLPLLVKCGNADLSAAAALDLAGASDSDQQAALGDAWWDVAEKEAGATQLVIRRRAASWYSRALEGGTVAGLKRVLLEKRIAAAPPTSHAPAEAAHARILSAVYGNGERTVSLAKVIQAALDTDPFTPIDVGNSWGGDPCGGARKTLKLSYQVGETAHNVELAENEIHLVPPIGTEGVALVGASVPFKIIAARYGGDNRWVDGTEALRAEIVDPSQPIIVRNMAGGKDVLFGKVKRLVVYFEIDGRRYVRITAEKESMTLIPK